MNKLDGIKNIVRYSEIIKSVLPDYETGILESPFKNIGIDSIDLLSIREDFEREISKVISDEDWLELNSLLDIIQYCDSFQNSKKNPDTPSSKEIFSKKILTINMPQMANGSLSENWFFKELGDNHWNLLTNGLSTKSSKLVDDSENRLYATFVRIRITSEYSINDFLENENLRINGAITRYGNSMYFSNYKIESIQKESKFFVANLMSSFSIRKSSKNNNLIKSQPSISINAIENQNTIGSFGNEYRLIKKNELKEVELGGFTFNIENNILFQIEHEINPYYEINGVGLLYFASYPTISDFCEAKYFNSKKNIPLLWELAYSTSSRDVFYYGNCDLNDSIIYTLNFYNEVDTETFLISNSLHRKSDNKLVARIFTIKKKIKKSQ